MAATQSKTTRRDFAKLAGAVTLGGTLFPRRMLRPVLQAQPQAAPGAVLVVIFARGGMDGLNVVVPYGEGGTYYDRRPSLAIPEPDGSDLTALDLDGFFGLHPALRPLHEIFQAGHLAVVHAAGSPDPSRSHFEAMESMERATPGDQSTASGWINRHLQTATWQNPSPFRAIALGTMTPYALHGPQPVLGLQSISSFHLSGRSDQLAVVQRTLASLYHVPEPTGALDVEAAKVFASSEILTQIAQTEYVPEYGAEYPDTTFGRGLKQIAQLIKAQIGLEVVCLDSEGWDLHESEGGIKGNLANNLALLARGLGAFYADLQDYWDGVTVVTMSEFGRRVAENASQGTDHGRGNCMFVIGGGVNGGVYADWPGLGDDALDDGALAVTTDYRDVLAEILTSRVLNPAVEQIFPDFTPTPQGILVPR